MRGRNPAGLGLTRIGVRFSNRSAKPIESRAESRASADPVRPAQFTICPPEIRPRNLLSSALIAHYSSLSKLPYLIPLDCLVNCGPNRPGDNSGDFSPDCAADSPEHHLVDCLENRGEDNLPQSLADSLDHRLENHSADYSADCPANHLEDNLESNPADNLPDYSADCLVNRLPDHMENYLVNYRPSAVFSSLSAARTIAPRC